MQLRFAPPQQRKKQLDAAEKLLSLIDESKQYPFEFIEYHITGHRIKPRAPETLIDGRALAQDLRNFIARLSNMLSIPASIQDEKVYTLDELARQYNVSTKTIQRWRKRGLVARRFLFDDGKKRLAFLESSVKAFLDDHPDLVQKASQFRRLDKKRKQDLIRHIRKIAADSKRSRNQVIEQAAKDFGIARETARYTIIDYDQNHPDKAIFGVNHTIEPQDAARIYELYQKGMPVKTLMKQFNRSKSSIYRIINQRRLRLILNRKIDYIASDEFAAPDAQSMILGEPLDKAISIPVPEKDPLTLIGRSVRDYLQALRQTVLLNREQEMLLFRRYNFLKFLADRQRDQLRGDTLKSSLIGQVERWLDEAQTIQAMIMHCNLRLVISIARKHTRAEASLSELISEGNIALMHAVEQFDYTLGYRFSTYASWIIAKDYAGKFPQARSMPDVTAPDALEEVERDLRTAEPPGVVVVEQAHRSLADVIKNNLDSREQYVILNHFGLVGNSPIRRNRKTLNQIGKELDLSKERIRQIELVALQKLRQCLSIEQFELLTK